MDEFAPPDVKAAGGWEKYVASSNRHHHAEAGEVFRQVMGFLENPSPAAMPPGFQFEVRTDMAKYQGQIPPPMTLALEIPVSCRRIGLLLIYALEKAGRKSVALRSTDVLNNPSMLDPSMFIDDGIRIPYMDALRTQPAFAALVRAAEERLVKLKAEQEARASTPASHGWASHDWPATDLVPKKRWWRF